MTFGGVHKETNVMYAHYIKSVSRDMFSLAKHEDWRRLLRLYYRNRNDSSLLQVGADTRYNMLLIYFGDIVGVIFHFRENQTSCFHPTFGRYAKANHILVLPSSTYTVDRNLILILHFIHRKKVNMCIFSHITLTPGH